jgi:hypothetical protein
MNGRAARTRLARLFSHAKLRFGRSSAVALASRADTAIRRAWRSFAHLHKLPGLALFEPLFSVTRVTAMAAISNYVGCARKKPRHSPVAGK